MTALLVVALCCGLTAGAGVILGAMVAVHFLEWMDRPKEWRSKDAEDR